MLNWRDPRSPLAGGAERVTYAYLRELVERGHTLTRKVGPFGGYQGIRVDSEQGVYYGGSESRKDGQAAGY